VGFVSLKPPCSYDFEKNERWTSMNPASDNRRVSEMTLGELRESFEQKERGEGISLQETRNKLGLS
jgi:hypothetical protein